MTNGNPDLSKTAARCLASAMAQCAPHQREAMLAMLLAHTTAALAHMVGNEAASEATYSLGDALVAREVA